MKFAGFNDWVEIFKGGKQIDSQGREHDGDALIERAIKGFDPSKHEPPLVVGHPATDAPAFGWVKGLRFEIRDGVKFLLAKFDQVLPEFAELVKKGVYKKRSAAFYPDGRLRHVGFLGAAPPAVAGLANIKFEESDAAVAFEFNYCKEAKMTFAEFIEIFKFWKQVEKDPSLELPAAKPAAGKTFSEQDLEAAKKQAADEAKAAERKQAEAEFAERQAQAKREAKDQTIASWCDTKVASGKLAPAWIDGGIKQFMQGLDDEQQIEFTQGQDKKSRLEWFKGFLGELPKLVDFSEIATRDKNVKTGDAASKLDAMVKAKMKEDKSLTYAMAFSEAQAEHPDLAAEYQQSIIGE